MAGKPIATVGAMHMCPMCSGTVPHIGGAIVGPGAPNILINGKPVALMGDLCTCAGGPDTIVEGVPNVLVNGVPVVTLGCMTAHGGNVVQGEPTVIIESCSPNPIKVMPIPKIPFPEIKTFDRVCSQFFDEKTNVKEAEKNQAKIKNKIEKQSEMDAPVIYNLRWLKAKRQTSESRKNETVDLVASVLNINDGELISFTVECKKNDGSVEVKEFSGVVEQGEVSVTWKIEENNFLSNNKVNE